MQRRLLLSTLLLVLVAADRAESSLAASERVAGLQGRLAEARAEVRRAEEALASALEEEGGFGSGGTTASTCNARIWSAQPAEAAAYLEKQHSLRAPYYLKSATRSYEAGMRQKLGEDKSNSDPFIKQYEGMTQIVGALELAPEDAGIWLEAGKVGVQLASLTEDSGMEQHVLSFLSRACTLDAALLPGLSKWLTSGGKKGSNLPKEEQTIRKRLWKKHVKAWNGTGIAGKVPVSAIPSLTEGSCALRGGVAPAAEAAAGAAGDAVGKLLNGFQMRSLFPTRVLKVNVNEYLPKGFVERLSDICINKYAEFAKKNPNMDPNDLNDRFFGYQVTNEQELMNPQAQQRWPQMYQKSEDFKLLLKVIKEALKAFVSRTGLQPVAGDDEDYSTVLWAAVYPGNGGRHGYHVHQGSISSCVLYAKTAGATTPISFVDPRGAPPVNDYEQHEKERDFEPVAPFHHNEYFFPEAGDLVCFPSWLVHNIPSHWETQTRVAFAANYQGGGSWDAWHRTAVGWH